MLILLISYWSNFFKEINMKKIKYLKLNYVFKYWNNVQRSSTKAVIVNVLNFFRFMTLNIINL